MNVAHSFTDDELVSQLKNGSEAAMTNLYKLHWKKLYISSYKILKDKEACEDIIQELFIKIWQKRQQLTIHTSIESYLFAAVRYEVYRKLRENKRFEPIVDEIAGLMPAIEEPDPIAYKELELQIEKAIASLPVKCKQVYELSRHDLMSHKEIAEKLVISTKTVRNHITRALRQVRVSVHQILMLLL